MPETMSALSDIPSYKCPLLLVMLNLHNCYVALTVMSSEL